MKIPVKTNIDKFYRQLVGLLSSFAPIKKLRPRELDVLAEILYQNYVHRNITEDVRHIVVFSYKIRQVMQGRLGIKEDTFNVHLNTLRKNGIIEKDNKIPAFLIKIIPDKTFEFTVLFNLNEG